jgi:single-stranded DNA-binding protein
VVIVNHVILAGSVSDRPFRPGGGNRTVVKLRVGADQNRRAEQIEFDAFGKVGDYAINLWSGDAVVVHGRLEDRTYRDGDEQVNELRVVAEFIEVLVQSNQRTKRGEAGTGAPTERSERAERSETEDLHNHKAD